MKWPSFKLCENMTVTDMQQLIFDSVSLFYIHVHMHSIQETIQVVLVCFK